MNTFDLRFGALAPPVAEQLEQQGLQFASADDQSRMERAINSITFLAVHGFITNKEAQGARKRVINRIAGLIEPTPAQQVVAHRQLTASNV